MTMILDGSNGVTFNDASLQGAAASPYVLKNRIINGDMVIDQRNAGASVTPTNGQYSVDRWQFQVSQASKLTAQQSSVAPTGFKNSLLVTSSSAYSVGAADYFSVLQSIEGFNTADLEFGTANAKTVTLSFWVRSSLTGTFGGTLINGAYSRAYPFTYTISVANTWEQKSVTIAGDTTGTWVGATNGIGMQVNFGLGVGANNSATAGSWTGSGEYSATGATSVVGTSGATFYITGVQLEQNTSATPFERRLYGQELANCQRYYYKKTGALYQTFGTGYASATTLVVIQIYHPIEMRAAPTIAMGGTLRLIEGGAVPTAINSTQVGVTGGYIVLDSTGLTQYRPYGFGANNDTTAFLSGAAEL
jgi:hypothetical protein